MKVLVLTLLLAWCLALPAQAAAPAVPDGGDLFGTLIGPVDFPPVT